MALTIAKIAPLLALPSMILWSADAVASRHHPTHAAPKKTARHRETTHAPAAPHGSINVPAGGLKVFCQRNSPLLVRKMTQGAGTTVTVICR